MGDHRPVRAPGPGPGPAGGGYETSFGATYFVPWPDGFAHIGDGPALGSDGLPLPPEQPFGTTGAGTTLVGHGELGNMLYTRTSSAVTATATWTPAR